MNRKFTIGSVVILGAAVVGAGLGGLGWAQQPKPAQQPSVLGRTRVALVNLGEVMKKYKKFDTFKTVAAEKDKGYMERFQAKQKRLELLANELKDPKTTQERKNAIEQEARTVKFDMDNIRQEGQKDLLKFQEDQLSQMYREVYSVVSEYAVANQIDLVLRYVEDWDDYNNNAKVVQRMQYPFWSMYSDRSMDITGIVIDSVNKKFGGAGVAMPPANNGITPVSGPGK